MRTQLRQIPEIELVSMLAANELMFEDGPLQGEAAELNQADLHGKDLSDSVLFEAALHQADLGDADLRRCELAWAEMNDANLAGANIAGANMYCVDLRGANLEGLLGWRDVEVWRVANLYGVKNAPPGFLEWALTEAGGVSLEDGERWRESIVDDWLGRPYRHVT